MEGIAGGSVGPLSPFKSEGIVCLGDPPRHRLFGFAAALLRQRGAQGSDATEDDESVVDLLSGSVTFQTQLENLVLRRIGSKVLLCPLDDRGSLVEGRSQCPMTPSASSRTASRMVLSGADSSCIVTGRTLA